MTTNRRLITIFDLAILVGLFWIVRYWHSPHFGLYEDDLTIIPNAFTQTFSSLISFIVTYIRQLSGHARPLSDSFIYLFSWIGWRMVGLWGPYLIGYLITAINIGLFYWLMYRVMGRPFALLAGLGYILYSADTTQAYLTHSLGLQPSITLILLAFHCYLSNKRILAYILAFIVLFSYETPFLLFLVAPLLKTKWNKPLIKETLWHAGILIGMLVIIYGFRASIGEGRVSDLGLRDIVLTPIVHMVEGPLVSMGTFIYRPIQTLLSINLEIGLVVALSFAIFLVIISHLSVASQLKIKDLWLSIKNPSTWSSLPEEVKSLARIFITGIIMLVAAYPLTFTVRAYAISGRDTRVHFAGVAGAALLVGSFVLFLVFLSNGSNWRKFVNILISLELALMAGYGFVIQNDYVNAWQYQREFWTEVLPLIPDAGDGTIVLVDPAALHDTKQIGANYWNLPRVLDQLFVFPKGIMNTPVVYRLQDGWQNSLASDDGKFVIDSVTVYFALTNSEEYNPQNIILIQSENGSLVRRYQIELKGVDYQLKQSSQSVLPELPHGSLFPLLIENP